MKPEASKMEDTQRIVKCGSLSLHSPGGFFKRRWIPKYLVLYDGSKSGVKRLELFDSEMKFKKQNPAKIIALADCLRVVTCQRFKSTYTFEVRTSGEQFYLLAAQSFQDMNDWVNCLRSVAFGQAAAQQQQQQQQVASDQQQQQAAAESSRRPTVAVADVLLRPASGQHQLQANETPRAPPGGGRSRQRQPSIHPALKPQPPADSPFARPATATAAAAAAATTDTLTPTIRSQLLAGSKVANKLDEEEENMLYCSIEDNPSEHSYRVKVLETELALRCQLKCYQPSAPLAISQQYEQLDQLKRAIGGQQHQVGSMVIFYQLIVGPQELTLLNDFGQRPSGNSKQQGLWTWPYQCIRRYGFDKDNCFMFEAGRKCSSGPGQFVVQTPKAYAIYQDVVKFVNELRSVGAAIGATLPTGTTTTTSSNVEQHKSAGPTITQIPVAWAPVEPPPNQQQQQHNQPAPLTFDADDQAAERKEQFFETLRQLDSTLAQSAGELPPTVGVQDDKQQQEATTKKTIKQLNDTIKSNRSSETDESGYEQGDDSVESGAGGSSTDGSSNKSTGERDQLHALIADGILGPKSREQQQARNGNQQAAPARSQKPKLSEIDFDTELIRDVYSEITKLHAKFAVATSAEDSMSSSGASSSGGQESQFTFSDHVMRPNETEPLKEDTNTADESTQLNQKRRRRQRAQQATSNQCEEPTYGNVRVKTRRFEQQTMETSDQFDLSRSTALANRLQPDRNLLKTSPADESTENKSNLTAAQVNSRQVAARNQQPHLNHNQRQPNSKLHLRQEHHNSQEDLNLNQTHNNHRHRHNQELDFSAQPPPLTQQSPSSALRSSLIYPSVLNPIPECNELSHHQAAGQPALRHQRRHQPPPVAPKPGRLVVKETQVAINNNNNNINNNVNNQNQLPSGELSNSERFEMRLCDDTKLNCLPRAKLADGCARGYQMKRHNHNNHGKPTNHYVINDVQYAKISRRMNF